MLENSIHILSKLMGLTFEIYFSNLVIEGYLTCGMYEKGLTLAERVLAKSVESELDPTGGSLVNGITV